MQSCICAPFALSPGMPHREVLGALLLKRLKLYQLTIDAAQLHE
jgi:hypothetical protein